MLQEKCPPHCGLAVLHVHRGGPRRILDRFFIGGARMAEAAEPISIDDVISAHELLWNYEGDVHGLFAGAFRDPRFTEWLIKATCDRHGAVENTVSVEAGQKLSARQHVVCPQCLRGGITRRFIPQTVIRVEEGRTE